MSLPRAPFQDREESQSEQPSSSYPRLPQAPMSTFTPSAPPALEEDEETYQPSYEDEAPSEEYDDDLAFPTGDYEEPAGYTEVVEATTEAPSIDDYPEDIQESIEVLLDIISSDESTEVLLNGPTAMLYKKAGARYQVPDFDLGDKETYHRVINDFILSQTDTKDRIGTATHLLEGQMEWEDEEDLPPVLARVHVIAPPVVKYAKLTIAKKARVSFTLDDIASLGAMTPNMAEFLKAIAKAKVVTVIAGLSGAGKTTLLEAMSYHFDANDRIIVVEDTPELRLPNSDTVYMTTTASKPGVDPKDVVTMEWLVKATNRMRPDRIIVGEVRGGEMGEFLIAANSGADGSMTTIHAANPRMTLDKMLSLAMKADGAKNENTIRREIASTVQLVVQASLIDGKHVITHIEEVSTTVRQEGGTIATQTLFEYDRNSGRHVVKMRPTEQFQQYMAQRGVPIELGWFTGR